MVPANLGKRVDAKLRLLDNANIINQVLHEVAAARHVIVICGSTEIDGYAFCFGLKILLQSQKPSYIPELQSLPSLINLQPFSP